jgi:peptidoglycan/LPS O-acetylase OafA/YrhL
VEIKNPVPPVTSVLLSKSLLQQENNNFNLIRLAAALLVLVTHSFELTEDPIAFLTGGLLTGAYLGVCTFFFLSGLLVTQSLRRSTSWRNFLWHRFLRLYPAATLVVLLCAFLVGPIATTLNLKNYFSHPDFYNFLSSICLFRIHFTLPGVWEHARGGPALISPFWTIALELKLYVGLLIVYWLKIPGKRILAPSFVSIAFLFNLFFLTRTRSLFAGLTPVSFNPFSYTLLTPLFITGVLCNLYREKIRISRYWIGPLMVLLLMGVYFQLLQVTTFIVIPAFILYLATHGMRWMKKVTPRADLSYGIYLFGGPVGRMVFIYAQPGNDGLNLLLNLLAVLPLAYLSWYGLEKRMLSFKNKVQ